MGLIRDFDGVTAIDTGFGGRDLSGCCYLITGGNKAALIDSGTRHSVGAVLEALQKKEVAATDVDFIIVTHAHLDHAGGAGALARELPHARVVAHEATIAHLVDPEHLVAAVARVFGNDVFAEHFGEPLPVPEERVLEVADNHLLELGELRLKLLETSGHVDHHLCVVDENRGNLFAGDALGYAYPEFTTEQRTFCAPATPPSGLDRAAMELSFDRLEALRPQAAFLGHGGQVTNVAELVSDLKRLLDKSVDLAKQSSKSPAARRLKRMTELVVHDWHANGAKVMTFQASGALAWDLRTNIQGLDHWLRTS